MTGVELNDFSGVMNGFVSNDVKPNQKNGYFADFLTNAENGIKTDSLEDLAKRVDETAQEIDSEMNSNQGGDRIAEKETKTKAPSKKTSDNSEDVSKADDSGKSEVMQDDIEKISEKLSALVSYVANLLDVPQDAVYDSMQNLDMSVSELLSENGINELVMNVCNLDTPMDIVTNGQLFEDVKMINEFAENLMGDLGEELNLTAEEIDDLLGRLTVSEEDTETVQNDIENLNFKTDIREESDVTRSNEEIQMPKNDIQTSSNTERKETSKDSGEDRRQGMQSPVAFTTGTGNSQNVQVSDNAMPVYEPNAQEIFDQIGEYIKNLSTKDTSEVEIALHPEELGNLHIRVSNQDGIVTAKLIAENEAVKNVLESQLVTLKASFEEQGIKVNSVEVSVETKSFDQGMNQNSESGSRNMSGKKASVRRINLAQIDDMEDLDDEELMAVEMMKADGNSVDYKA